MHSGNLHCLKAVVVMADCAVGYLNSVCSDHRHHACRRENFLRCVFNHLDSRSKMQICRCQRQTVFRQASVQTTMSRHAYGRADRKP